ncbi:hypothetical protein MS3_00000074 [Schistosoma haematobium]|uniref:Uncharacterized protein n=1 Tax=Schistosoma haematobium TaxID=6185 RepID=A0A922LJP4_SCHHA|nr:hypothetical protein MS3_00000074 [Schistosoma haematobium]KAH9587502.1 hypothetical protein MS3_00000074 [Schistosoma haematobium]
MSKQLHCIGRKLEKLPQPSSTTHKCLLTAVYVKYFRSVDRTLHYQQQPTVGENKPDCRGGRIQEEALEVDRTHIDESIQLHHKTSTHLDCSWPKRRKRKFKQHITQRNADGYEKNEQELERTREAD